MTTRRFCLVLVKPSHYDDDGYVIQWFRSPIPSNSLACLYGLRQRHAPSGRCSGEDVATRRHRDRRDQHARSTRRAGAQRSRRRTPAWSCWSACSRTSFRARSTWRGRCAKRGHRRRHRRLPRLGHALDARRRSSRTLQRGAGARASRLRRRGGRAGSSEVLRDAIAGTAEAALQFHGRPARHRGRADPALPAERVRAHRRRN